MWGVFHNTFVVGKNAKRGWVGLGKNVKVYRSIFADVQNLGTQLANGYNTTS